MQSRTVSLLLFLLVVTFFACEKSDESNAQEQTRLDIYLTDGPGDYQQVNVDILQIRIKTAYDTSQWLDVPTKTGVYNLLDFQKGVDTLLASGMVPANILREVRFVLGNNNSVMVDSILYPMETPSAQESGLKIKVDKTLAATIDSLTLDFDAEQSVLKTGNGMYKLKPVIKVK
jgi:hypothetical protein